MCRIPGDNEVNHYSPLILTQDIGLLCYMLTITNGYLLFVMGALIL